MNSDRPFVVFCGYKYYPAPGWQGYCGDAETLEEAQKVAAAEAPDPPYSWWQIVDLRTKEIVAGEGSGHTGLFGECPANPNAEKG